MSSRNLLWVGDSPTVPTGFSRVTNEVLGRLSRVRDVAVLGLNERGDPRSLPYPVWPAKRGPCGADDAFGVRRLPEILSKVDPDEVVILNDPWNVARYLGPLSDVGYRNSVVAACPVDGWNQDGTVLAPVDHVISWTDHGVRELRRGGYTGPATAIPHGVDLDVYSPRDRDEARSAAHIGLPEAARDGFVVGAVATNTPRKRLDLTIRYFSRFLRETGADAYLFVATRSTSLGYDLPGLAHYYGLKGRFILHDTKMKDGRARDIPEPAMPWLYSALDVHVNTAQGEGWGLPVIESMACGVPNVVPDWAALGEWPGDAALKVPCSTVAHTLGGINVLGALPDEEVFVETLARLYEDEALRTEHRDRSLALVSDERFRWDSVASGFLEVLDSIVGSGCEREDALAPVAASADEVWEPREVAV